MTAADSPREPRGKKKGASANREGRPWERADGRWVMRLYPPEHGVRKRPRYIYGKTRREGVALCSQAKVRISAAL